MTHIDHEKDARVDGGRSSSPGYDDTVVADLDLLDAWRGGDRAAGSTLFERYFLALYRFFRAKVGGELDDLVQRSFAACVEARVRLRPDTSFRAYLFACARTVLQDHFREHYRGKEDPDPDVQSVEDLGTTPSAALARAQEHRLLLHALRQIPINQQIALELFYWEGLSGSEIAAVLDVPEGTVRTHINRGRHALAERLTALMQDPSAVQSTLDDLGRWANAIRVALGPPAN